MQKGREKAKKKARKKNQQEKESAYKENKTQWKWKTIRKNNRNLKANKTEVK